MVDRTPYQQLRQIDFAIRGFGLSADIDRQDAATRKVFSALRQASQAAQAILKDYELSESEEDTRTQVTLLPKAIKGLEKLRQSLLKASECNIVGPVDVAQFSAEIDDLIDRLR